MLPRLECATVRPFVANLPKAKKLALGGLAKVKINESIGSISNFEAMPGTLPRLSCTHEVLPYYQSGSTYIMEQTAPWLHTFPGVATGLKDAEKTTGVGRTGRGR